MSIRTLTPSQALPISTEDGVYTFQLNQTLTGSEEIAITGGGQTFHTFNLSSVGELSGITLAYALDEITLTASGNSGDLKIGVARISSL
jgi:hypothetical protein